MAKKKKRRLQTPSLSPFDQGLYILLDILSPVIGILGFASLIGTYRKSVLQDPHVLALSGANSGLMMLGLVLGGCFLALFETLRQKKQPIFGKSGIQYGPPRYKPVYPLFSRAFWRYHQKKVLPILGGMLVLFMVLSILTALVLPLRTCLFDDGSIVSYNSRNEEACRYEAADITEVRLYTDTIRRKGIDDWTFGIQFTTAKGSSYDFLYSEFRHDDLEIRDMLRCKALFSHAALRIDGADRLSTVVKDQNLTPEETELLYELFENTTETR